MVTLKVAMGKNPVPPENITIPTKIDLKWVVHLLQNVKMVPWVWTHSQVRIAEAAKPKGKNLLGAAGSEIRFGFLIREPENCPAAVALPDTCFEDAWLKPPVAPISGNHLWGPSTQFQCNGPKSRDFFFYWLCLVLFGLWRGRPDQDPQAQTLKRLNPNQTLTNPEPKLRPKPLNPKKPKP